MMHAATVARRAVSMAPVDSMIERAWRRRKMTTRDDVTRALAFYSAHGLEALAVWIDAMPLRVMVPDYRPIEVTLTAADERAIARSGVAREDYIRVRRMEIEIERSVN